MGTDVKFYITLKDGVKPSEDSIRLGYWCIDSYGKEVYSARHYYTLDSSGTRLYSLVNWVSDAMMLIANGKDEEEAVNKVYVGGDVDSLAIELDVSVLCHLIKFWYADGMIHSSTIKNIGESSAKSVIHV